MKVIWPLGQATVREVYDALRDRRTIAYTTVQTMMNILETKGHLKKEPGEKAQIYVPVRPQQTRRQIDGARIRQPRLRRLGAAAAGPPAEGKGPDRTRTPRAAEAARQGGRMTLCLSNLAAYSIQLAALVSRAARRDVAAALAHAAHVAPVLAGGAGDRPARCRSRNRAARSRPDCCESSSQFVTSSPHAGDRARRARRRRRARSCSLILSPRASSLRLLWLGIGLIRLRGSSPRAAPTPRSTRSTGELVARARRARRADDHRRARRAGHRRRARPSCWCRVACCRCRRRCSARSSAHELDAREAPRLAADDRRRILVRGAVVPPGRAHHRVAPLAGARDRGRRSDHPASRAIAAPTPRRCSPFRIRSRT